MVAIYDTNLQAVLSVRITQFPKSFIEFWGNPFDPVGDKKSEIQLHPKNFIDSINYRSGEAG